ncbi:MAG: protein kinase domain-containing protein, partial [Bacteroidota bacterium]
MDERVLHYGILRPLGAGGMGEVYLAEDERLGRRVALKFLPRADSADPERRERLRREARALASLSHPGIAGIFALEEHGDRLFLVMEYIEGETLAQRLAHRPLPVSEVIDRGRVLAEALAHAHTRGVVHRDVKPSNILITPEGATKLADFGLALHGEDTRLTAEGSTAGTADHMSPEQTRGDTVDRRSDLFSLGVVLYEALTGVRPFARPTLEATFHAIRADEPEPPTALRSGIPLELERIVMKLMRKDPAERYQTAADLAADLRALHSRASGSPPSQPRPAGVPAPDGLTETTLAPAGSGPRIGATGRNRLARRLLAGAAALAFLIFLILVIRDRAGIGARNAEAAPRSIAVLSFQQMAEPSDPHGVAAMATSLLTVALGQSRVMPVLSNQRVHDVLRQMGKTERAVTGADALEVGRRAGAAYIVIGYIYRTDPEYVVGAEVSSTKDGAVLTSCRAQAPGGEQGLFAAIDSLTSVLERGLSSAGVDFQSGPVDVAALTTRNPAAYRAYVRGVDLLNRAERVEAAKALAEAVQADSTFGLAWYYLGVATWWLEDFDTARRVVDRAMRSGRLVGREREGLDGLQKLIQADYPGAARRYRALLERYPDDKEFLYGLGEALFHQGDDIAGARTAFDRTIALDPTFAVAFQHIVDIDVESGSVAAVVADCDRLQHLNPTNPVPTALKMDGIGRLGDAAGCVAIARELLARDSGNPAALRQLAIYYRMTGDFDSAAVYTRLVQKTHADPIMSGGVPGFWLLFSEGRYREADRRSAEAMRQFDFGRADLSDIPTPGGRAHLLQAMKRYDEAWPLALQTYSLMRRYTSLADGPLTWLGHMALDSGHDAEARRILAEYDALVRDRPNRVERRGRDHLAGAVAFHEGRLQDAVRLL